MPQPPRRSATARWWVVGVLGVLLSTAVIVWFGLATTVGQVTPEVTSYSVESDAAVRVEYDLHRPKKTAVRCVVTALDSRHGRVGTLTDEVPAAGPESVHRVVTVRTGSRAVTGVVDSCTRIGAGAAG